MPALFLLLTTTVFAQPEVEWHYLYGHIEHGRWQTNQCWSLCKSSNEGYVLAGEYHEYDPETRDQFFHIYIQKTNINGEIVWSERYRDEDYNMFQRAIAITQSADEGYILAGHTYSGLAMKIDSEGQLDWMKVYERERAGMFRDIESVGDNSYVLSGDDFSHGDIWLLKIDGDGEVIWSRSYGGDGRQWGNYLVQTRDGGYIVSGGTSEQGQDRLVGLLLKVDADGNQEWLRTFGMNDTNIFAGALVETPDGGIAVAGSFGYPNREYPFVYRFNADGEILWSQIYQIRAYNYTVILNSNLDNGFILGALGAGGVGQNVADLLIVHINSEGELIWQKFIAGVSSYGITGLIELEDHSFVASGTARRPWIQGESATDAFTLLKTTPDPLAAEPAEISASPSHDFGEIFVDSFASYELTVTNSGRRYADILSAEVTLGQQAFAVEFGEIPRLFPGDTTALRLVFSPDSAMAYEGVLSIFFGVDTVADTLEIELAGVGVPNVGVRDDEEVGNPGRVTLLSVSPNPFNSTLTISFTTGRNAYPPRVGIYDVNGRLVADLLQGRGVLQYAPTSPTRKVTWDASASPAGIYFVRLQSGSEIVTQKVVLLR